MPLSSRVLTFPVSGGLDTETEPRWLAPGTWRRLENCFFDKVGRLRKRNGVAHIASTAWYLGGIAQGPEPDGQGFLTTFRDQLIDFDDGGVYVRSTAAPAANWTLNEFSCAGRMGRALPYVDVVDATVIDHTNPAVAHNFNVGQNGGGITCMAWEEPVSGVGQFVYIRLFDYNTGAPVVVSTPSWQGTRPLVIATNGFISVWYVDGATIKYRRINPTTPGVIEAAVTVVAADVAGPYDIMTDLTGGGANDRVYFVYHNSSTGLARAGRWNVSSGTISIAEASLAHSGSQCVGWHLQENWAGNSIYCTVAGSAAGVQGKELNKLSLSVIATTPLDAAATTNVRNVTGIAPEHTGIGAPESYWEVQATPTYNAVVRRREWNAGSAFDLIRSCGLAGKPFNAASFEGGVTLGSRPLTIYVPLTYDSTFQASYFLLNLNIGGTVSRFLYGAGGGRTAVAGHLPFVVRGPGTSMLMPVMHRQLLEQDDPRFPVSFVRGMSVVRLTWNRRAVSRPQDFADGLYVPGGCITKHPSAAIPFTNDQGFQLFPETPTLAQMAGGSLTLTSTYSVCVVYYVLDSVTGRVIRSEPSAAATVLLTGGNNRIDVTASTYRVGRGPVVLVEIYRTEGNGLIFYRDSDLSNTPVNSVIADTVSYSCTKSDTALLAGEPLYTTGRVLGAHLGPPCAVLQVHRERLWAISTEDGSLWYTHVAVPGLPAQFNPKLKIAMTRLGGPPTALASMDDKLVIFKAARTDYLIGDGPDRQGNGPYKAPEPVDDTVGCPYPQSVISNGAGVFFKSQKGWYRLTRGLLMEYIGARVEAFNNLTVTGAVDMTTLNQIRWSTVEGTTLVYDYVLGQWSTFTNQAAESGCAVHNGVWKFLHDGILREEKVGVEGSATGWDDNGVFVQMVAQAPPLSLAQIGGAQRIRRMKLVGDAIGRSWLNVSLRYNYRGGFASQFKSIDLDTIDDDGAFEALIKPDVQKCTSLELTIDDSQNAGGLTGGAALAAIAVEFAIKKGLRRLPAANTMG